MQQPPSSHPHGLKSHRQKFLQRTFSISLLSSAFLFLWNGMEFNWSSFSCFMSRRCFSHDCLLQTWAHTLICTSFLDSSSSTSAIISVYLIASSMQASERTTAAKPWMHETINRSFSKEFGDTITLRLKENPSSSSKERQPSNSKCWNIDEIQKTSQNNWMEYKNVIKLNQSIAFFQHKQSSKTHVPGKQLWIPVSRTKATTAQGTLLFVPRVVGGKSTARSKQSTLCG